MTTASKIIAPAVDLSPGLARFNPNADSVIEHSFWEEVTLQGIAEELAVSPAHARQLEMQAVDPIKNTVDDRTKSAASA